MVIRKALQRSASWGAMARRFSSSPMKAKFSGRPTRSAPRRAAISICSSAAAKLASGLEVLVSCRAAARKLLTIRRVGKGEL
jgi:hypothetical protein